MKNAQTDARKMLSIALPVIGVVLGIAFVATGLYLEEVVANVEFYPAGAFGVGNLTHLGQVEFGADFYTEIYTATAFTGNVLKALFDIVAFAIPKAFELTGVLVILSSLRSFFASPAFDRTTVPPQGVGRENDNAARVESHMQTSDANDDAPAENLGDL